MIDADGFEQMYAADPDPFGVAGRWYERRKQTLVVAALTREHYDLAWDCASGTGHLALALLQQQRCDAIVASDAAPAAVDLSRELLDGWSGAHCIVSALPAVPAPAVEADLVLVTEVLYYLAAPQRRATMEAVATMAATDPASERNRELISVHWRHHPDDAHLSGADVTAELHDVLTSHGWVVAFRHDDADFVLAGWTRPTV